MEASIPAVYRDGVFVPTVPCEFPQNAEVEVCLKGPTIIPPRVADLEEQVRIRRKVVERMSSRPLSPNAPRFTREELHERR